ncbi:MAG: hypothetical protein VW547_13005 [Alphaproteobacteria bacterium]
MAEPKKDDSESPEGPDGPKIVTWRLTDDDRALFMRARELSGITGASDLVRFALGAAVRELTRAGGGSS